MVTKNNNYKLRSMFLMDAIFNSKVDYVEKNAHKKSSGTHHCKFRIATIQLIKRFSIKNR